MHRVDVVAFASVFAGAGGAGDEEFFAGQSVARPLLEQGRAGEPVHGELQDDAICGFHRLLLGGDVDAEAGVEIVHPAHNDIIAKTLGSLSQRTVDP